MAQGDDPLATKLAVGAMVATKSNIDTMGISKSDTNGQAYFGRSFNETHPEIAARIDQKHKEQFAQKPGRGTRLSSLMQTTNDYVRNTAFPAVRNFFKNTLPNFITKTVPSFFKRMMGSKAKETLPDKMAIHPDLLAAKQQADEERKTAALTTNRWQAGQDPQSKPSNSVIMGSERPPDLGAPPLPPEPSEPSHSDSRRSSILTEDELEGAKKAKENALKRFQDPRPEIPHRAPKIIMSPDEEKGAKEAMAGGKIFKKLEVKGTIPPRPETPPRKRPIVSPGAQPMSPIKERPALSSDKKTGRPLPIPPDYSDKKTGRPLPTPPVSSDKKTGRPLPTPPVSSEKETERPLPISTSKDNKPKQ